MRHLHYTLGPGQPYNFSKIVRRSDVILETVVNVAVTVSILTDFKNVTLGEQL